MDKEEFCDAYITWFPENEERYREHKREFPHILLHVFSVFAINIPMAEAYAGKDHAEFEKFCSFIEYVWRKADDEVLNVLTPRCWKGYLKICRCGLLSEIAFMKISGPISIPF